MGAGDWVVLAIIAGLVIWVVHRLHRKRGCGCGCGCTQCAQKCGKDIDKTDSAR